MTRLLVVVWAIGMCGCTVNINDAPDAAGGTGGAAGIESDAGEIDGASGMAGMGGTAGFDPSDIDDSVDAEGRFSPDPMQLVEVDAPDGAPIEDRCGAVRYWERTGRFASIGVEPTHGPALFPGNVVDGDSARSGQLTRINATLAPITFSVSLQNASTVTGELSAPGLSAFRMELNDLLSNAMSAVAPAQLAYHIATINSAEEMSTALGGDISFFGLLDFGSELSFQSATYKSRFLISFDQTYYTVDAEPKDRPSDYFAAGAMPTFDSPPLYVQSIRYGRRVFLLVKSTHYEEETRDALSVGLADAMGGVSFGATFSDEQSAVFDEISVSAIVIGGSSSSAVQLANGDLSALQTLLSEGAEFSPTNPGAPIDFQLAYLLDNAVADLSVTSAFVTRSCVDVELFSTLLDAAGDGAGDPGEFFGPIDVYVTEDASAPCAVMRGTVVGGAGSEWPGDEHVVPLIQVPSGADRPVCISGHLYEEDVVSDDDYGEVEQDMTLPVAPMRSVATETPLSDGVDNLTYQTRVVVLGPSPIPLD